MISILSGLNDRGNALITKIPFAVGLHARWNKFYESYDKLQYLFQMKQCMRSKTFCKLGFVPSWTIGETLLFSMPAKTCTKIPFAVGLHARWNEFYESYDKLQYLFQMKQCMRSKAQRSEHPQTTTHIAWNEICMYCRKLEIDFKK
jgi:hypothetical protein